MQIRMRPQFQIEITGTFFLGLAWTALVCALVFGLSACGGSRHSMTNLISTVDFAPPTL